MSSIGILLSWPMRGKQTVVTSRRVRLTYDDLDELAARAHPDNPKRHDIAAIDSSISRFGYVDPILVNDTDGRIIGGHGRIDTLLALRASGAKPPRGIQVGPSGEWLVPAVHGIDLSPVDARAFLIADNRTVELGGWDEPQLAELLSELARSETGLDAVGFSQADLSALLEDLGIDPLQEGAEPDYVPEEPSDEELYAAPGQLWRLGEHLLFCGDATQPGDVARLLAGRKADLAVTDPPYNVSLGRHGGAAAGRRGRLLINDSLNARDWEKFVSAWATQLFESVNGAVYVFMSGKEWPVVSRIMAEVGGHWSTTIIWAKDRFVIGRSDYQRQYEPVWYGWRQGSRHHWCGDRDQGDVWWVPRPASSDLHPTMKPVALVERMIANSSTPGSRVLDLFLGSGTTVIAAERLGRRCLGMELESKYVQVSIERWQRYTGRTAVLEEG